MVKLFALCFVLMAGVGLLFGCSPGDSADIEPALTTPVPAAESGDTLPEVPSPAHTATSSPLAAYTQTSTPVLPTITAVPTRTATSTRTSTHTATSTPVDTPTWTPTSTVSGSAQLPGAVAQNPIKIYMIAPDASGSVCNGTAVGLKTGIEKTNDLEHDIEAALNALIHTRSTWIGSYYNPLSHSEISSVKVSTENGKLIILFRGAYNRVDDPACNNSLVRAQVWSTIKQFGGLGNNDMTVYMNNKFLGDILAGK